MGERPGPADRYNGAPMHPSVRTAARAALIACALFGAGLTGPVRPAAANQPPLAPTWIEPTNGAVVSPFDPHYNTHPFSDPDPGDGHLMSDFEVWDDSVNVRVWADLGETEAPVHVHSGDGVFEGPLTGETRLNSSWPYRVRARFRDDSNTPNDWGPWSAWIYVRTSAPTVIFPLQTQDIPADSSVAFRNEAGGLVDLPSGVQNSTLVARTSLGSLVRLSGTPDSAYVITNYPTTSHDAAVSLLIRAGGQDWTLPESRLEYLDQNQVRREIYLPRLVLTTGDTTLLWVDENGATYYGQAGQSTPDFTSPARDVPTPWFPTQSGVVVEKVVSGLYLPVSMAFIPNAGPGPDDAFFFVCELYGKVKVVMRDFHVHPLLDNLLNFDPLGPFPGTGEMGVSGLCYYPPTRGLYVSYVYDQAGTKFGRVIRANLNPDLTSVASVDTIFGGMPTGFSHQIQAVTVGPDGMLYVNTGDGNNSPSAQNLADNRGKILRMTLNGGLPPDNPFPGTYVYAYGLRNPFGAAWQPGTGRLFVSDNGPDHDDRIVKVKPGSNNGWCCNQLPGAIARFTPTVAPVGLLFMPGGILPAEYNNRLFLAWSGPAYRPGPSDRGKQIWTYTLDDTGGVASTQQFLHYVGNGYATCVGLATGPDGLYFTDIYGDKGFNANFITNANIYRVRAGTPSSVHADVPPPARPLLVARPNPSHGTTRLEFTLAAPAPATLTLFDAQGRLRRTITTPVLPAGLSSIPWDGRDDANTPLPNGVYFLRLTAPPLTATTRLILAR